MRKRWLALGLMLAPSMVWAQCQPTNSPTLDFSNSKVMTPGDYAAQGGITATINADGSHRETVGAGTLVHFAWSNGNAKTVTVTVSLNGQGSVWSTALSTSDSQWSAWGPGDVFTWTIVSTGANGQTSQDRAVVTVTSQSPGIYSYDNLPSNSYAMVSLNYNGTPNIPYTTTCTNAAEKDMLPTAQLNLSNDSGENRNGVTFQGATTVVGQPVSATAYDYISFVPATVNNGISFPGDIITVGAGGFVYCSAIGDFWQGFKDFQATIEAAVTFSQVTGFVGQNASLRNWCLLNDIPPDYNPNILLNAQPGATYAWGAALCLNSTWSSGFWLCTPGVSYSLTGTYTRKPCTHNPPPY